MKFGSDCAPCVRETVRERCWHVGQKVSRRRWLVLRGSVRSFAGGRLGLVWWLRRIVGEFGQLYYRFSLRFRDR